MYAGTFSLMLAIFTLPYLSFFLLESSPNQVCNSNFYILKTKLKMELHQPQLLLLCFTILTHLHGYSPHQNASLPPFQR